MVDKVERLRKMAFSINLNKSQSFKVSPEEWFDTITAKIDLLKKVDTELSKQISQNAELFSAIATDL